MKRAEQQKNDLVVYLAHDIKTPLTSVIGYLSLLDETPDMPDEEKAKYIHTAWEKANRLRTLVNEFFLRLPAAIRNLFRFIRQRLIFSI